FVPSHAARPLAGTLPAWTKLPATISSVPSLRKARTAGGGDKRSRPGTPPPPGGPPRPFPPPRLGGAPPPPSAKPPPTTKSPPASKSAETGGGRNRMMVEDRPLTPPPNGVHAAPFQRAIFVALAPLAPLNRPPA